MATPRKAPEDHKPRGRPRKQPGEQRSDRTSATTDLSRAERDALTERHGSVYAGLRAAVELLLGTPNPGR